MSTSCSEKAGEAARLGRGIVACWGCPRMRLGCARDALDADEDRDTARLQQQVSVSWSHVNFRARTLARRRQPRQILAGLNSLSLIAPSLQPTPRRISADNPCSCTGNSTSQPHNTTPTPEHRSTAIPVYVQRLVSLNMASKETKEATDEAPVDTRDALEVLESEAKEWDKVRSPPGHLCQTPCR